MHPREARWAAVAVAAGLLLAGVVVWGTYSRSPPASCPTAGPGNTPLGTAFALSTPVEAAWGGNHWYNSTVQSAGGGMVLRDLNFAVGTSSSLPISPGPTWNVTAWSIGDSLVGVYRWGHALNGTWEMGSGSFVTSQETLSLYADAQDLSGDIWMVTWAPPGACSHGGLVSVSIP